MPRVLLLIPTHTTRHLEACLASLAHSTRPPDALVVTCDVESPAIAGLIDRAAARLSAGPLGATTILHAFRPHQGEARLNQVRNNGLRALDAELHLRDDDLIVVLDGDTMLAPTSLERHAALAAAGARVILPYRVNLDPERTALAAPDAVLAPTGRALLESLATPADLAALAVRQRRLERQRALRTLAPAWMGLVKAHKPKLLGGHHAVAAGALRAVNGYDERFAVYGYDDDDLARRLYLLRPAPRPAIAVREAMAFHLYHETRSPGRPGDSPDHAYFSRPLRSPACEHGWRTPRPQPEPTVRTVHAPRRAPA